MNYCYSGSEVGEMVVSGQFSFLTPLLCSEALGTGEFLSSDSHSHFCFLFVSLSPKVPEPEGASDMASVHFQRSFILASHLGCTPAAAAVCFTVADARATFPAFV